MASKTPVLTKSDYTKTALRSFLCQNGFNYNTYQGIGYLYVMLPALRKIYASEPEKLADIASKNMEFYNTSPHMLPFISNLNLAMYDHDQSPEDARSIKMALMGPLAGIGDSLAQFGVAPLMSTIFAGLAADGLGIAPLGFFIAINLVLLALKLFMGRLGYKLGTSIIDTLSAKIKQVSAAASIIGVTVIAGLATNFVKVKLAIQYQTMMGDKEQIISLQNILDKIMPRLLPVLLTIGVFYLVKKKKWSTYKLLALLFVIGILGALSGFLIK